MVDISKSNSPLNNGKICNHTVLFFIMLSYSSMQPSLYGDLGPSPDQILDHPVNAKHLQYHCVLGSLGTR